MSENEWLEKLKTTDEVLVSRYGRFGMSREYITKIARFTPTTIVTTDGYKFRKKDGHIVGSDMRGGIHPVTQEKRDYINNQIKKRELEMWFSGLRPNVEQLEAMKAAYEQVTK